MGTLRSNGLFGKTRQAVLTLLLLRPDEQFHVRHIAELCQTGLGAVQRELASLTQLGILHREPRGVQVYYQANRSCPFFRELQSLITKTTGVVGVLRKSLAPVEDRLKLALVFGSVARGEMNADSDVDLLVLSKDLGVSDLAGAIRKSGQQLGREISINLYQPSEWKRRVSKKHPLARTILTGPRLIIMGDERELGAVA